MGEIAHRFDAVPVPAGAGIGLRSAHYAEFLATRPALPFVEVHSENYFAGGRHLEVLLAVRRDNRGQPAWRGLVTGLRPTR